MEHLLLAPLGRSPGAVLSLLDWLNAPEEWVKDGCERRNLPRVTHLWVVTTCDEKKILKGSLQDLKKEVQSKQADNKHLFDGLQWRVFIAGRVQDITSTKDAAAMAEILYRLVLHGEAWRDEPGTQRHFSVSITGGRKTMSADLQRAATFFEVDTVLQMVYAGEDRDQPYDLSGIRRQRKLHHPVITASEKTPWRPLLEKPWSDEYPGRPLVAQNFPLHDGARDDLLEIYTWPQEDTESLALTQGLNKIAGNTKKFADQALACGVGPYFLRHDLRKLIDYLYEALPGRPELKALTEYMDGLGEVIDEEAPDWSEESVCVENLLDLCNRGLILAVGQPVHPRLPQLPQWQLTLPQGEFLVHGEGWPENRDRVLDGIPEKALLLVLRNFFANAWNHGRIDGKVEARLSLTLEREGLSLTCRNRLPPDRLQDNDFGSWAHLGGEGIQNARLSATNHQLGPMSHDFLRLVEKDGSMPLLLQPFRSVPSPQQRALNKKAGDGLGLFTVARTVERTRGAVQLIGPRLEPWPHQGKPADFVIGLLFTRVTRGGA